MHPLITHSLMSSFLSLAHFPTPLVVIPGIVTQINPLPVNPNPRVDFWENPDEDKE